MRWKEESRGERKKKMRFTVKLTRFTVPPKYNQSHQKIFRREISIIFGFIFVPFLILRFSSLSRAFFVLVVFFIFTYFLFTSIFFLVELTRLLRWSMTKIVYVIKKNRLIWFFLE